MVIFQPFRHVFLDPGRHTWNLDRKKYLNKLQSLKGKVPFPNHHFDLKSETNHHSTFSLHPIGGGSLFCTISKCPKLGVDPMVVWRSRFKWSRKLLEVLENTTCFIFVVFFSNSPFFSAQGFIINSSSKREPAMIYWKHGGNNDAIRNGFSNFFVALKFRDTPDEEETIVREWINCTIFFVTWKFLKNLG